MIATTQGNYESRYTGNYLDNVYGFGSHKTPITFREFLAKPESAFFFADSFMQNPKYLQIGAELAAIENTARLFVRDYIKDEFFDLLLSMQNYVRWGKLFENRCNEIAAAFWSQVNLTDQIFSKELEQDESHATTTNSGTGTQSGTHLTTNDQTATSHVDTTNNNDTTTDSTQTSDSSNRAAVTNLVRAESQLTNNLQYNWQDSADQIQENRSRAGDTNQHTSATGNSASDSNSTSHSVTSNTMENVANTNTGTSETDQNYTNKQYMQERQWAIDTARGLLPLTWLRQQLRTCFNSIY